MKNEGALGGKMIEIKKGKQENRAGNYVKPTWG